MIATDGLWDYLNSKDVASILHNADSSEDAAHLLFNEVMQRAADYARVAPASLMKLSPGGKKRRIHDDISLIVYDLLD